MEKKLFPPFKIRETKKKKASLKTPKESWFFFFFFLFFVQRLVLLVGGVEGGYAEYAKAPAINIIPVPDGISFEEAAAFPLTFVTSWHMLIERARLSPGEYLLIIGAGR